ncbi:MAG: DUF2855 family protein [Actinobacteria bacterium]|nr:DUF2855 family protein [Actinomycetota bacterium]
MSESWTVAVKRDELAATTVLTDELPSLEDGDVLLKVDRVGLTTNNVTYAVLGATAFRYWDFFPTESGLGVVPVWGFGNVEASKADGVEVGSRVYGYFPTASHLIVTPGRIDARGFNDVTEHRADLPAAYNAYTLTATDPSYDAAVEDLSILFRPLFWTSFLLADQLAEQDFYGATQLVFSSASSKTAYGTAAILKAQGHRVVGLTSAGSVGFTRDLGCYDAVLPYDDVDQLADIPTAYVDFAGSTTVSAALREHFGDRLVREVIVGVTHQQAASPDSLSGSRTTFFFAPDQMRKRASDWGRDGLDQQLAKAWSEFVPQAQEWVDVVVGEGRDDLTAAWLEVLSGAASPRTGHVLAL